MSVFIAFESLNGFYVSDYICKLQNKSKLSKVQLLLAHYRAGKLFLCLK